MAASRWVLAGLIAALTPLARAETYSLTIPSPAAPTPSSAFHLGTATTPDGPTITVNGQSLLSGGAPILPVMGEFHFSRYEPEEWREELLKMKAGGITIISTYVFWNHHEEIEGQWDWSGRRDLRKFLKTCKAVGLPVIVRLGPWCHGEVRNGGIPDWLLAKKVRMRSEDPAFLDEVKGLYGQIAKQMDGLLYKDGGPVIGVQVDNEYRGRASYLLALKKIAREAGIDTPLYTRTGWPNLTTPMPFGEILPLYGAYAEGFWDRELTPMPGTYWQAFTFGAERTDTAVGTDELGKRAQADEANAQEYPYLTCELGGGMEPSYHRRIHIDPRDAFALEIAKVGSGSNLPGFYMYHGGTNPDAKMAGVYLNETQGTKTTNYNDMPVKDYDFQAPLGAFGQVRESYHLLRRTNLFLHDWQETLARMAATFPAVKITKSDSGDLRWAVRSDGKSGFVFINNYQRGLEIPAKEGVQFALALPGGESVKVPAMPMKVPADDAFFVPFNMDLHGETLVSASAQPVCQVREGKTWTVVFAAIEGVTTEFVFSGKGKVELGSGAKQEGERYVVAASMGLTPALRITSEAGETDVMVVNRETSLRLWRATLGGKERILLTSKGETLFTDGKVLTLQTTEFMRTSFDLMSIPALEGVRFPQAAEIRPLPAVTIKETQEPGKLREIQMGVNKAATEPTDADFAGVEPAVYHIQLLADTDSKRELLLRLHYVGDVARIYLGDKLLDDNFYNGQPFDLSLTRFAPDIYKQPLILKILPLQKGAPIYMQKEDMPDFGGKDSAAKVISAEVVETRSLELHP